MKFRKNVIKNCIFEFVEIFVLIYDKIDDKILVANHCDIGQ